MNSKLKMKELIWQLELLINLRPDIVGLAVQEQSMSLAADDPLKAAKNIVDQFASKGYIGLTNFLSNVNVRFNLEQPDLMVKEILKSWSWCITSSESDRFIPEVDECACSDLPCMDEAFLGEQYDSIQISFGDGIILGDKSGVREGFARLFDPLALNHYGQENKTFSPERYLYNHRIVTKLIASGPYRRFSFGKDTLTRLEDLRGKVANFTNVLDRVMDAVNLSLAYERPIRITPILLVGEPGIGKSYFADQLSKCLGVPLKRVAMDNLQVGAGLAGSSYIYSNSEAGAVFKVLADDEHISPLVILDELDKAGDNSSYGDPLSPLHNLLEPVSAKDFEDASVGLSIDASHVIWIATANNKGRIPPSLVSRFEVFEISSQNSKARESILEEISDELVRQYPGIEFDIEIISALVDSTPREQRHILQRAIARAVRLGESKVTLKHLCGTAPGNRSNSSKQGLGYI